MGAGQPALLPQTSYRYLASQYGNVLKVNSVEELQMTKRGLMKDGKASGSRTYFLADAKELVFGKKARERQLLVVTQELKQAESDLGAAKEQEDSLTKLRTTLNGLREFNLDATPLLPLANELSAAQQALAALDLTELEDMQRRLDQLVSDITEIDQLNDEDTRAVAGADKDIAAANRVIAELLGRRDSLLVAVQTQTHRLGKLVNDNPVLNFTDLSGRVDVLLAHPGVTVAAARDVASGLDLEARHHLTSALNALSEYHQVCRNDERFQEALTFPMQNVPFDGTYRQVVALTAAAMNRVSTVRGTGIYNNQLELEKATKSFNDVFTKHFCVEIKTRVDEGMRTLRQMNNELRNLSFGQDSYIIDWSQWEPELRDYLEFFEAVAEITERDVFREGHSQPLAAMRRARLYFCLRLQGKCQAAAQPGRRRLVLRPPRQPRRSGNARLRGVAVRLCGHSGSLLGRPGLVWHAHPPLPSSRVRRDSTPRTR
jgi:hypothetical protein